jgi:hypothetical protein
MIEKKKAADGEAADGSEGDGLRCDRTKVENIGESRRDGEGKSREIEPDGHAGRVFGIAVKADLQKRGSKTDGRDDDNGKRAAHRGVTGIEQHTR